MKKNSISWGLMGLFCIFMIIFASGCSTTEKAAGSGSTMGDYSSSTSNNGGAYGSQTEFDAMNKSAALKQERLLAEAAAFSDIFFAFDQYDLNTEARNMLEKLASWLSANNGWEATIEGHCDDRGTTEYNLALGERRAQAAKIYLTNLGIEESRISTISYGEEMPLDPANNETAWAKNRRDHFVIVSGK